jgi:hypothetical protein
MADLDALAKHGQLLLTLASSDAPTKARDAANSLDDAIVGLSTSRGHVASDRFKSTAEGFATSAAEAAKLALEVKIAEALDKTIIALELLCLTRPACRVVGDRPPGGGADQGRRGGDPLPSRWGPARGGYAPAPVSCWAPRPVAPVAAGAGAGLRRRWRWGSAPTGPREVLVPSRTSFCLGFFNHSRW